MQDIKTDIVKRNFSRFAKDYETTARLQKRVAEELVSQSGKLNGSVLDIGAGPGMIKSLTDWDITALDLSFEMCALNKTPTVNANMAQLPFANASFNNAIASLSLQWATDIEQVLAEVNRILKPGGRFAFSTFSPNALQELNAAFAYLDSDSHLMQFIAPIKLFAMLKKAGFENLVMTSQKISYIYPNMLEALRSIKNIGASHGFSHHKGLRTAKYFQKLENIYKGITKTEQGVPLNWEVLYIRADKA